MTILRQYPLVGLKRELTLRRCKEKTYMTGSRCLTAAALRGDSPIEWLDGRLTGKEKRWRRENGRCLNMRCRYPGHLAEMCSAARAKSSRAAENVQRITE